MTEETGATIDIDQDGTVKIASVDGISGKEALRRIELITADVEVGKIYDGKVVKLMDLVVKKATLSFIVVLSL